MTFDPARKVKDYHAALESRDLKAVSMFFNEAATYNSKGLGQLIGRVAILEALKSYFAENPEHSAMDQSIIKTGEYEATSHWTLTTGQITRAGQEHVSFDENGRITKIMVVDTEA